jgi:hypothetical protein
MSLSLGVLGRGSQNSPQLRAARDKVFAATKANKIFFLESMNPENIVAEIKEGVMVGPASEKAAEIGRQYTKRQMPW